MSKKLKIMSLGVINHGMSLSVLYLSYPRNTMSHRKPPTCSKLLTNFIT